MTREEARNYITTGLRAIHPRWVLQIYEEFLVHGKENFSYELDSHDTLKILRITPALRAELAPLFAKIRLLGVTIHGL